MPAEWDQDEAWQENHPMGSLFENKNTKSNGGVTLRPPLYNAEDYASALQQLFYGSGSSQKGSKDSVLIEHSSIGGKPDFHFNRDFPETPPEMKMKAFVNGSELLFKLEADLRHAFSTFVQEFISVCEGVTYIMEALKAIQNSILHVTGLREQRKLLMDEQKCMQCLRLCLRNIEAVSKLSSYPGGLYPLAAAMISTVTTTRIIALEILTAVCTEGGPDGHFKVTEAISTLRLRMGEPIRCKLLIGAVSSAPPGTFQAKGIRFFTAWVASAGSPRQKVHIQCELEEAGFNPAVLRKGADLGGAREAREVQTELDAWDRVSIDVDTLTRQNCQLRNSVATLQQELATLKDKLKRMDVPQKAEEPQIRKRSSRTKRTEELVTTPADSEEEAEQIHQILEDLNNIVNSELNGGNACLRKAPAKKKEKDIVPVHLLKSPPPKKSGPLSPRPWPGSSASDEGEDEDENDSDMIKTPSPKLNDVRRVVELIEKANNDPSPKLFKKNTPKSKSMSPVLQVEPKPDYKGSTGSLIPIFHQQNRMASKFANFKSSKLYSSSPDNQIVAEVRESTGNGKVYLPNRFSAATKKTGSGLRRSESLHTSLASISTSTNSDKDKPIVPEHKKKRGASSGKSSNIDKWKSMENLDGSRDDNFTLRWRYPVPDFQPKEDVSRSSVSPNSSPKSKSSNSKPTTTKNGKTPSSNGVMELFNDYRQNRFSKNSKSSGPASGVTGNLSMNIFSRYSKKSAIPGPPASGTKGISPDSSGSNYNEIQSKDSGQSSMQMFSLPPMMFVTQGMDISNHRICDLPSGLY